MGQTKLDAGDAVGEQVAQAGSQKDRNRFVDVELAAQAKDAVADKRPGNRHREGGWRPSVVSPPCASSSAWNSSTMMPITLIALGPNRMAPSPVPVGWELEPVTLGILRAESTKA